MKNVLWCLCAGVARRSPQQWMVLTLLGLAWAATVSAAPFDRQISFTQPDGTAIQLHGKGDEFYAVFETLDGYTVVFDPAQKAYCYAAQSTDGRLYSTGAQVHQADAAVLGIDKGVRMSPAARKQMVVERWQRWEQGMEIQSRWAAQKAASRQFMATDGPQAAPPPFTTTGLKVGLTLLVDFSDDPATVPQAEIVEYCNGDNYTGYGNNGSIKSYFLDNSNGQLLYTNVVTIYIRAPQAKSVYNDPTKDCGDQANILIKDALDTLKALPNYATEILPLFDALTVDGNNQVVACNVFYAGGNSGVWMFGLWPHSWALYNVGAQELSAGGKKIWRYQITDIGGRLEISTFSHENGHMLCGYPDLYDYDYDSVGGAGLFCLMGFGGQGGNPSQINAYLKRASGWATVTELDANSTLMATVSAGAGTNFNHFYRFQKPGVATEYYLVENRQATGRDAILPASGVAIWHIDELGNRDDQRIAYNTSHANYECSLVQADNQYHFQRNSNPGDSRDLYRAGNDAPGYLNEFSDPTQPSARWWDGTPSGVLFSEFSVSAETMTFRVGSGLPLLNLVSTEISGGNGNGIVDYNECNNLTVVVTNAGIVDATSVEFYLSSSTPGVAITRPRVSVPVIPGSSAVSNQTPFKVSTAEDFVCGTPIDFALVIKSDQTTRSNQFRITTGQIDSPVRFDSFGPVFIPDGSPQGGFSPVVVSGISGAVGKLALSLYAPHSYVSDLTLELISPDGVTNRLATKVGSNGRNFGAACMPDASRTTFDDDATNAISGGVAPFLGSYRPEQSLALFNGKSGTNVNGVWWLRAVDDVAGLSGSIQCWSLLINPAICTDGGGECPGSDLAIRLVDNPDPVVLGSNLVYTITVTNTWSKQARGIIMNQSLPSSVAFVSATTTRGTVNYGGNFVTASLGDLPAHGAATITVTVLPLVAGNLLSSASVAASEPDINPGDNSVTASTSVLLPSSDLAVSVLSAPEPTYVGGPLNYTVTVVNNGPATATGVMVTNTLPASVLPTGASASKGSVAINGSVVVGIIGALGKGQTATVSIAATPLGAGTFFAASRVVGNQIDPLLANNLATVSTRVGEAADLGVSLVDQPDPVVVFSNFTYFVRVTNRGPNVATEVVVNQILPGGVYSVVNSNLSQGSVVVGAGTLVWNVGSLAVGAFADLALVGRSGNLGTLNSVVTVNASQTDPNPANNTASASTLVASPFVQVVPAGTTLRTESLAPANGTVDAGEKVTVDFRLANAGNVNNTNLVATLLAGGGVTPETVSQTYGVLPAGGLPVSRTFTFTAGGGNGGVVTATFQLTDGPNILSNVVFTFQLPRVSVFQNPGSIVIPGSGSGTPYPSTLTVSGVTGTVGRVSVTLSNFSHTFPKDVDVLLVGPLGQRVVLMSAAGDRFAVTNTSLTFDDVAAEPVPETDQLAATAYKPASYNTALSFPAPAPAAPYAAALSEFAGLNPNGAWSLYVFDHTTGDRGDIWSGWSLAIQSLTPVNRLTDLGVAAAATPNPVEAGENVTWTFTITNSGPAAASSVTFSDPLPVGVTLVSVMPSKGTANVSGSLVTCNVGGLGAGEAAIVTVVATPTAAGVITNTATATSVDVDLNSLNNTASAAVTSVLPLADLAVTQIAGSPEVVVGSNVTFTISVHNSGPGAALATTVTDALPAGFSVVSVEVVAGSYEVSDNTVTCAFGKLLAGQTGTATITARALSAGAFVNMAAAQTASNDPDTANNAASEAVTVRLPGPVIVAAGAKLLAESQSPANGCLDIGETVTVSLSLRNAGQVGTANLVAALQAGAGVGAPSGPQSYGALAADGAAVARPFNFMVQNTEDGWVRATVALSDGATPLGSVTFTFALARATTFTNNNAIVIPDRGAASPYPSVIAVSGLTGQVTRATVTLNGLTHAFPDDVDVLLVGPQGQQLVLMSDTGGGRSVTNLALTFADAATAVLPDSDRLESGTFKPTDYEMGDVFPGPAPKGSRGTALSVFNGTGPNGGWSLYIVDDSTGDGGLIADGWSLTLETAVPVSPLANVRVAAAGTPGSVFAGAAVTYTLQAVNAGPAAATGVTLTQVLPMGAAFVSAAGSQGDWGLAGGNVIFNVGTLASGEQAQFTVVVRPNIAGAAVSTADIAANETDLELTDNAASVITLVAPSAPATLTGEYDKDAGAFVVVLTGQEGATYALQASPDLVVWDGIATNTAPVGGLIRFSDTNAPSLGQRYYRAVRLAP